MCSSDLGEPVPLPPMDEGTEEQFHALAGLRQISLEGIMLASTRGLLRFGVWKGRNAWFVTDCTRRVAQARRLDGKPWSEIASAKAWTICGEGDAKWPIGIQESKSLRSIALVEGGPDLLAAFHFIFCEAREHDCGVVAMLGASHNIHPDAVTLFSGRRVRIFGHADKSGNAAAKRWFDQLTLAGAEVDACDFGCLHGTEGLAEEPLRKLDGSQAKDLNDLCLVGADDFEANRELWRLLP